MAKKVRAIFDKAVAAKSLASAAKTRSEALMADAKKEMLSWWAAQYQRTGAKPSMANFFTDHASVGFVVSAFSKYNAEKAKALHELGIDPSPYTGIATLTLNVAELAKIGKLGAVKKALDAVLTSAEVEKVGSTTYKFDGRSFMDDLPSLAEEAAGTPDPAAVADMIGQLVEAAGLTLTWRDSQMADPDLHSMVDILEK